MSEAAQAAAERLVAKLEGRALETVRDGRGVTVRVALEAVPEALATLKQDSEAPFDLLADVTAIDWSSWAEQTGFGPKTKRFSLLYNVYAVTRQIRLFLEAELAEDEAAPTASGVYSSANWAEREIFDMFGIRFDGHPDLRRILLSETDTYYPLRKEYPRRGHDPQDFPQE